MKYAFVSSDGTVVQVITGQLSASQQNMFLNDYRVLFGAESVVSVDEAVSVWIGGMYTDGVFSAPYVAPEPVLIEPVVVETDNDVIAE